MTFKIERTSDWRFNKNDPPCKKAVAGVEEHQFKERVFDEKGKRVWQYSPRQIDIWTIEINTLEDLMELEKEVGVGVIVRAYDDEMPEIEIYDDYRE